MRLLCSEEDMVKGGCDSSGLQGIFPSSKRTKSAVWAYSGYYKNAQGQLVEDGSPICRSCGNKVVARGGNTSNLLTFTLRPSPSTVQRMQGKLTLSSGDVCVCRVFSV